MKLLFGREGLTPKRPNTLHKVFLQSMKFVEPFELNFVSIT